ncbi:hypothetical protein HOP50_09g54130 [Chloropicon primus]|uniref:Uncharacterized protein n=1 Tax=Chloropicon primus TaxID=1764295 RepID=A0A5B8MTA8_9CHLO|nr:hypothetical protein A3770_09p53830 [Chloropicon primus]UPR02089.1 hypothetical protein HOP50_09g54130 [Chloropicon primus]|mmetsp:Transcript_4566/g.13591  ORF Transcript_4566/g.13591 Transcript_4566/m.13591 type:complete len:90 (-) Transcript_4566:94-363(-)|eukprot:QDZ22865.1 hypothetical protein A3770_09p53830 [Chloropicon primus]
MKLEVRAEWRVADDACESGVQKYQYQSNCDQLHESFKYLKTESNRLLTAWMSGKKMKVEEIDVLEEKVEDEEDEAEANPASPDAKKQKT